MKYSDIQQHSLITAIKTPFDLNGNIDLDCFDKLIEKQIENDVDGLVVCGTTGEGHLLNWEEHLMLIAHAASKFGDKLLIIGNTGSNNTREAIKATEHGFAMGMHAALQINPYYGRTSDKGVLTHLQSTIDVGPVFIYNVPGRTGQDISPTIIKTLAEHENFVGVKECAGNERIAEYESQGIACWSGNDDECFDSRHQHGAHGVISVTSNIVPSLMKKLMDDKNESELNQKLQPLFEWLFCEPNPIAVNTALSMTGAINPIFRLPYLPLDSERRNQGFEILQQIGKENLIGTQLEILDEQDFHILP